MTLSPSPLLGPSIGPLIGGILCEFLGWQSTFYFTAIFGRAGIYLAGSTLSNCSLYRWDCFGSGNFLSPRNSSKDETHHRGRQSQRQQQRFEKPTHSICSNGCHAWRSYNSHHDIIRLNHFCIPLLSGKTYLNQCLFAY